MHTKSTVKSPEGKATFHVKGQLKGIQPWVVTKFWFKEVSKHRRPRPEDNLLEVLCSLITQCLNLLWKK
jgi:hypothetical protein